MKFSIAIPAYKAKYFQECIDSVLQQSYTDFEVVIVDDASPENIYEIVQAYPDNRIRYYKNEKNIGAIDVVDNWNKCLEYATGEYIICMGDDDRLLPNCLEVYLHLIDKYPNLGVYHAWTEIIDDSGKFVDYQAPRPEWESVYSLLWNRWKGRRQYIGDFLFDTKQLRANGGFYKLPLAWCSDDITATIAATHNGIANTQIPTFQYRENRHTISRTGKAEQKILALLLSKKWHNDFLSRKPTAPIDIKYWMLLQDMLEKHFDNMQCSTIREDINNNTVFRFVYWFQNRKKYNLNSFVLKYILKKAVRKFLKGTAY